MTPQELLNKNGITLDHYGPGSFYTICPQCSAGRSAAHRKTKCLSVKIDDDGICWNCHHCGWVGPPKGSGEKRELQSYIYRDAKSTARFRKVRNLPGREPRFWLERPDGKGGWIKGAGKATGVDTDILYRVNEVLEAVKAGRVVAVVEGEKDADTLWHHGIAATTCAHGTTDPTKSKKEPIPKWKAAHTEQLRGADIVVLNDNDPPGYLHADAICKLSLGVAKRVRRLDLAPHWPGILKGGDVSDWLAVGGEHTPQRLLELIEAAPDYMPPIGTAPAEPVAPSAAATDEDAELTRLAKLPLLDYERARKALAEALGTRASILDRAVAQKRAELGLNDDGKQGRPIEFPEPQLWPEPVSGAALLDDVAKAIRSHVVMPDQARDACALWVAHTYLFDRGMISPRLCLSSPVKGCGKTTALDVVGQLVLRPLTAANCSSSSVFRVVESFRPCLLIDEADSFLRDNEELRGVLNSGHRKGGAVLRNVGDDHEPRSFSTFAPCAIALIGNLPGTLADRSITINLARRKKDEAITPFRFDRADHLTVLARKLARWKEDNAEAVAARDPEMPDGVINRASDNWRPLLAIAEVAGGEWPDKARKAAASMTSADDDHFSLVELALSDMRTIFAEQEQDRMSFEELVTALTAIEGRPWATYAKDDTPMKPTHLAALMRKAKLVTSRQWREEDRRCRGYQLSDLKDAFERYLPPEAQRDGVTMPDLLGFPAGSDGVTPEKPSRSQKSQKPNDHADRHAATLSKEGNGQVEEKGLAQREIDALADWLSGLAAQLVGDPDADAKVQQALRERLQTMVLAEHVDLEAGRVCDRALK
jgi:Protein of unknown function (DUF3631)